MKVMKVDVSDGKTEKIARKGSHGRIDTPEGAKKYFRKRFEQFRKK